MTKGDLSNSIHNLIAIYSNTPIGHALKKWGVVLIDIIKIIYGHAVSLLCPIFIFRKVYYPCLMFPAVLFHFTSD